MEMKMISDEVVSINNVLYTFDQNHVMHFIDDNENVEYANVLAVGDNVNQNHDINENMDVIKFINPQIDWNVNWENDGTHG